MIASLAWKNIWRSKRRSFAVIGAILVGVWALIFLFSFLNSFNEAYSRNAINHEHSHLQIHHPDYIVEPDVKHSLEDVADMISNLSQRPDVASFSPRQIVNGMIASSKKTKGTQIYGVDPENEKSTTGLAAQLVDGAYFEGIRRNPVLISADMADELNVRVRSKVVVTMQNVEGDITSAAFRVAGIFESSSPRINKSVIFARRSDLNRLVGTGVVNEIAIMLNSAEGLEKSKMDFQESFGHTMRSYRDLAPEFDLLEQQSRITKQVLTAIIMLALLFGIINTMLMAVLERTKEIGMLRSVGMHRRKIFSMITLETVLLGSVGGPVGLLMGWLTVKYLGDRGFDLSAYADGLKQYGYDTIFYPNLEPSMYVNLMFVVIATAFIGGIYPALKAINLNPLEAIRKI